MSALWDKVQETVAYLFGMQEYVYGFPLVMMDVTREVMTDSETTGEYKAPINQFARLRTYVDPDFKDVVRISVNSLWSHGFIDLDAEPMIVSIPDMKGRCHYLIAGPKWNGTAPTDVNQTFRSTTRFAWVLVQMSAGSPKDFPEIHALQDQLKITPLSACGTAYTPPARVPVDQTADLTATPFDQVRLMTGATFFARLARVLVDNPPSAADSAALKRLKKLGVEPGKPFDPTNIDPDIVKGINKAPAEVWKLHYNADGSLDVYIQAKSPGTDKASNWLPCPPSGSFNLTVRSYQPMQALLDGTYKLPPVRRVQESTGGH